MITEDEETSEIETLVPPSWDEVEADEEYKALSPWKKQMALGNWVTAVNKYAKTSGEYNDDPQAGEAVQSFFKSKYDELNKDLDLAVESGQYEDNLWGGAKRVKDRFLLGFNKVLPASSLFGNRTAELAVEYVPKMMTGLMDATSINKLSPDPEVREKGFTQSYLDASKPVREYFRGVADYAQSELDDVSAAGRALGGGFVGELVEELPKAAAEAIPEAAMALATAGASVTTSIGRPLASAMAGLNVSSVMSGLRSMVGTIDAAEADYRAKDPTLTREDARLKALPEALTSGASTALVTRLGGFTGIESILLKGGPKSLRGKVWEVLKEAGGEGLEEAADQSLQDLSERFYRNPEKAWSDTYRELAMAYSLGAVLGGGFSAASQTLNSAADKAKDAGAPQTAAALRERVEKEAAIRTTQLFGDSESSAEADTLADELLGEMEGEDEVEGPSAQDAQNAYDEKPEQKFTPINEGVISQDTTKQDQQTSEPTVTTPEPTVTTPPTLRESVIASGIPEEAADSYISNLQAEGIADEQIQEMADNGRALREETAKRNEAEAQAKSDLARRARAGDPEARAQLERERGVNVTTPEPTVTTPSPTPVAETATPPIVTEIPQQQTTPQNIEGGDSNELRMRNQEEGQGRTEALNADSGAGVEGDVATPLPDEAPAPLPETPVAKLQQKRAESNPEEFEDLDPETLLSDFPATEAVDLLRQVGSTYEAPAVEGDETFADYVERTGVSVYDFDTRPTVLNEQERRYVQQGKDPFEGLKDLAAGRAKPEDFSPAVQAVSQDTPEEAERQRKAKETEEFYAKVGQESEQNEANAAGKPVTAEQIVKAPVELKGVKGEVSGKSLPVRQVITDEVDDRGVAVTKVVPGFVNDANTMAEVLSQDKGVNRVYVPKEDVANLDPEDIFIKYDESGNPYVVAARHGNYGVVYSDTGLTQNGESLADLHEPTRQKNSQAQIQGKRAKKLAKQAGVSVDEVAIPEMTDKFTERVNNAPISKEETAKPEAVSKTIKAIQDKAMALSGEAVTTDNGLVVTIDVELADRIGIAATNLYMARLRGVDRKGKFKDASGVVADIKKKVVAKLKKRPGARSGVSLDQNVGDGSSTVGDLVGQTDQNLDNMGYADVPLDTQVSQNVDAPTQGPTTTTDNAPAGEPELSAYDSVAAKAMSESEKELGDLDLKNGTKNLAVWKETLAMLNGGKKRKDLTPTRAKVVKEMDARMRERMRDLISQQTVEADTKKAKSVLSAEPQAVLNPEEKRTLIQVNLDKIIDWNGGATQEKFDIKRVLLGIAEDPKQPQLVKIFAKFTGSSNVDFSGVSFETLASLQKDKNWAGLYTSGDSSSTGKIQINVGSFHRGSIGQTIVHEALHHVAFHKLRPSYNRTGIEREAYRDLTKILTHIRRQVLEPEKGQTLSQAARKMFSRGDDMFYGLSDLDELFTETLTNTRFSVWMSTQAPLPDIKLKNTNIFKNLYEQVKQLFKNLIGSQNIRPDSLLSQAMDNILALAQDPQDDAKIQDYRQSSPQKAKKVAASLNAAAIDNPLGFEFKTQQAIRGMLDQNKRGALKGLTASPDGTIPWENLMAKLTKAFSAEEADLVLPALESLVRQGRVNVTEAAQALQTIADAKAVVTVLSAENSETDQTRSGIIHQLDSMYPDWNQDDSQYIDDPIFMGLRDELDSMDRGKIKETESATARFKQVNPKPLDEMDDAGDIVVEEPVRRGNPAKHSENMHFPTRKNVIGFGRKYTETLPNGEKATFVFEVQSDWAKNAREESEDQANALAEQERFVADNPNNEGARVELARLRRQNNAAKVAQQNNPDSPLLPIYENLVLKAAIQDALAKGQTKLIITDAETAMMTEQHDKYRGAGRPTQEPGMRAAYDTKNGRLHNIMRKLTGDKGSRVDLGEHQNIRGVPNEAVGNELGEIQRRFDADEITADQMNQQMRELRKANPKGSPVFKNPDGTPKTNITGVVYDLTSILENQEKVRALFAAPVNPSATPNPRVAKVDMMVQNAIGSMRTPVRSANLDGHPAQARMSDSGELEIVYDPEAIAIETEGLNDEESASTISKLLGHENLHIAGMINDYSTPDSQGRVGRKKIEAFHDEVMTDEMRQETADAYVRRFDGMTDAEYQERKDEFLSDKVSVAGEYKRMFTERYLTGESYEDSLKTLENKTGDKFADIVRGIADYLMGRIRMVMARYQLTKDPRLAAVILNDSQMLQRLSSATGMLGDNVTEIKSEILNASKVNSQKLVDIRLDIRGTKPHLSGDRLGMWSPKIVNGEITNIDAIPEDPTLRFVHNEGMMGSDVYTAKEFKDFLYSRKESLRFFGRNSYSVYKTGDGVLQQSLADEIGIDPLSASKAQIRRMKRNSAGWKASGWFGQGLMDKQAWDRVEQQNAEMRGANYRVQETARQFDKLVKKYKPNPVTLQEALGSTDNVLTDAQYDNWKKMVKAAKSETDATKRQAAIAASDSYRISQIQTNNAQKKADRLAALGQLPQDLRDVVDTMRKHIDQLSKTMIAEGIVGKNLQATLGANMEVYLNRSYEVFDNPEWSNFILTDQSADSLRIRNNAATIFRSQLVAEEARKIRRNARLNNQAVPTRQQALAAAQATVTSTDVTNLMEDYLRIGDGSAADMFLGGRVPGKKDTSIITLRGQIPKELRELMGEYKDAGVNYAKSYLKMSSFIANHNFQKDFLDMGLTRSTPFLWKEGVSSGRRPLGWEKVYLNLSDSPNPNPMADVYGPPIVAEAFRELNKTHEQLPVMKFVTGLTGIAMASKTIYNPPQTYVRNFSGNGLLMLAQGYLTNDISKLGFFKRFGNSTYTTGEKLFGVRANRTNQVVDYIERLTSLGVMGDNVKATVIKDLTSVIFDRDPKNAFNEKLSSVFSLAKKGNDRLIDAYQAGDDFWKILAFESERATFEKAYPKATPEALDRMAADRVRAVLPTYSVIPKFVKDIVKGQPYLAPYISWTSEIIRTSLNTLKFGYEDVRSGNPVLQKSGLVRLGSMLVAQGLLVAAAGTIRSFAQMDDDDEDALRRFLPEWQVNALIALTGKTKDGKVSFWDLSYLNPFDVIQEPFTAMTNEYEQGGSGWDVAAAGLDKAMAPWTGEQLFFGAVADVARGYTKEGYPLYEKADSNWNNFQKGADRIWSAVKPGAVNFAERIVKAYNGEVSPSGKVYSLEDELKGAVLGQKPSEVDLLQVFQNKKLGAFNRMLESSTNLATKEYRTRGTADLDKIKENYRQSNDSRMRAFVEIRRDVDALVMMGVPKHKVYGAMQARGVSKDDINQIAGGKYVRRFPGNEALENAVGTPNFGARIQALRDAKDSYPQVQSIISE